MPVTCFIGFLAGVPMCFDTGFLLFQMMDNRTGASIILMAFVEIGTLSWLYGVDKFFDMIKEMGMNLPRFMKWYWGISWSFTTPLICLIVLIKGWVDFVPEHYLDYTYEPAVQALGWILELYPIAITVIIGVWNVWRLRRAGHSVAFFRVGPMLQPKETWGPRKDAATAAAAAKTDDVSPSSEEVQKNGKDNPAFQA